MSAATDTDPVLLRPTPMIAGVVALAVAAIAALSLDGLEYMWTVWQGSPEFNHGPLIPLVALGFIMAVFFQAAVPLPGGLGNRRGRQRFRG
jgi:hypothetical protein